MTDDANGDDLLKLLGRSDDNLTAFKVLVGQIEPNLSLLIFPRTRNCSTNPVLSLYS